MIEALVIGLVLVGALACPVVMWLGRRGIGPGCFMGDRASGREDETIDDLRRRQRDIAAGIARLEAREDRHGPA